jgi:hypothetical protein
MRMSQLFLSVTSTPLPVCPRTSLAARLEAADELGAGVRVQRIVVNLDEVGMHGGSEFQFEPR